MNAVQFSYPIGFTKNLKDKPIRVLLQGKPLVMFRGKEGKIIVLEDRCPHRGVPLSKGKVDSDGIVCPYHGWTFSEGGRCVKIPGVSDCKMRGIHSAKSLKVQEKYGLIWVGEGKIPEIKEWDTHDCFYMVNEAESSVLHVMENALDPLHTLFIHNGWIRKRGKEKEVKVIVTIEKEGVHAETVDEEKQQGVIHKLLTMGRTVVRNFGRVIGPNCFQLEFQTSKGDSLFMTAFIHPIKEGLVRVYTANLYQTTLPKWIFKRLAKTLFEIAVKQDAEMLKIQSENLKHWKKEKMVSTKGDYMGPWIEKLLQGEELIPKRYEVVLNV
ncbi:MAG: aromatic ring-hydroxylating dioxygenase subunit alpha [Simkaniaceae bacterium]|nr:MAG: aromatic ring-hydroxylating dioxygenase subunit alpha [Simkaniaceae bacterium]